jgi:hypothetical protein
LDRSGDANQTAAAATAATAVGRTNTASRFNCQWYINRTNNGPFPNLAQAGINQDGSQTYRCHQLERTAAQRYFNGGSGWMWHVPGLPGTGTHNPASIIRRWNRHLPRVESRRVCNRISCDDGFVFSCCQQPASDTLGVFPDGDAGGGNSGSLIADAAFSDRPEDGIYPSACSGGKAVAV